MPFSLVGALVTSSLVENFLGVVADDLPAQERWMIEFLIKSSSRQIATHTGRSFLRSTYVEAWDGQASDMIIPREYPILNVTSIKFAANGEFASASSLPTQAFSWDDTSISLRENLKTPFLRSSVQVTYEAGFDEVPEDLQYATMIQYQYLNKTASKSGSPMLGLSSIAKMNESQTKDGNIGRSGLLAEVVGILENYRRLDAPLSVMFARVS